MNPVPYESSTIQIICTSFTVMVSKGMAMQPQTQIIRYACVTHVTYRISIYSMYMYIYNILLLCIHLLYYTYISYNNNIYIFHIHLMSIKFSNNVQPRPQMMHPRARLRRGISVFSLRKTCAMVMANPMNNGGFEGKYGKIIFKCLQIIKQRFKWVKNSLWKSDTLRTGGAMAHQFAKSKSNQDDICQKMITSLPRTHPRHLRVPAYIMLHSNKLTSNSMQFFYPIF